MCEKCVELDVKIERCRRLATMTMDERTLTGISVLLVQYRTEKDALHLNTEPSSEPTDDPAEGYE
jgi:hypothetical protein